MKDASVQEGSPKEKPIPISIEVLRFQRSLHEKRLELARSALKLAEQGLEDHIKNEHARLRKEILVKGRTSGDPFTDEVLCAFGVDCTKIEALIALNKRLMGNAGKECAIVMPWVMANGSGNGGIHTFGIILGFLSGNRIRITSGTTDDSPPGVSLPFDAFATSGLPYNLVEKRIEGPINLSIFQTSLFSIAKFFNFLDEPGSDEACRIFIGEEIEAAFNGTTDILHTRLSPDHVVRLRRTLQKT